MAQFPESGRGSATPLLIGVTGHRNPHADDMDFAEAALGRILADLRRRLPDTPLCVVSGIADGADRMAARVALRHQIPVTALLPMPISDYTADFSADSLADFHDILAQPGVEQIEIPLPPALRSRPGPLDQPARDDLYRRLGECLARKSNLILAFWDGHNTGRAGGTAEVLLRFLHSLPEPDMPMRPIEFLESGSTDASGPDFVCWIPMRRTAPGGSAGPSREECYLSGNVGPCRLRPHHGMPSELATILRELNDYNSRFQALAPAPGELALLTVPHALPVAARRSLDHAASEFAKADYLAVYNQTHSDLVFQLAGWLAVLMGFLFLVYAKLWTNPLLMYGYVAAFVAAFAATRYGHYRHWFSRHLMYRVIAETLRTRFFLSLAGVSERVSVTRLLHVTGISHFAGFSWISHVLRSAEGWVLDDPPHTHEESAARLMLVRNQWIESQAAYFRTKVQRLTVRYRRLERIKTGLLAGLVIVAVALLLFKEPMARISLFEGVSLKTFMIFLMGFLPLAFGVWEVYQQKMAIRELLWQYRNQAAYFSLADIKLGQVHSLDTALSIIENLGHTCLVESFLWAVHRYHREHEPAAAG